MSNNYQRMSSHLLRIHLCTCRWSFHRCSHIRLYCDNHVLLLHTHRCLQSYIHVISLYCTLKNTGRVSKLAPLLLSWISRTSPNRSTLYDCPSLTLCNGTKGSFSENISSIHYKIVKKLNDNFENVHEKVQFQTLKVRELSDGIFLSKRRVRAYR